MVLRHAHAAVEGGHHRRTRLQRQVYALVAPAVTVAELREGLRLVGAHERARLVHQQDRVVQRKAVQRDVVGVGRVGHPVVLEDILFPEHLDILDVVPGVVVPQDEQQAAVRDVQGVHRHALPFLEPGRVGAEGLGNDVRHAALQAVRPRKGIGRLAPPEHRQGQQQECGQRSHQERTAPKRSVSRRQASSIFSCRRASERASQMKRR